MSEEPIAEEIPVEDDFKTPFSFKLMIVLVVLYLGWRLVQGIAWLFQQVF